MYLDTGLAAKLYVPEPESDAVQRLVDGQLRVTCSELLITEFSSVLSRYYREEGLPAATQQRIWMCFQEHVEQGRWNLIPISAEILFESKRLIWACQDITPLRTLDAIHLATCRYAHPTGQG